MNNLRHLIYKMYLLKLNPGLSLESGFRYKKHALFSIVSLFVEIKRLALFVAELAAEVCRSLWRPISKFAFKGAVGVPLFLSFVVCSPIMVSAIQYVVNRQAEVMLKEEQKIINKYSRYDAYIKKAADKYRIDPVLIRAIIMVESKYNPQTVSTAGACGLMQLMPRTAKLLSVNDIFDPEENIMAGTRFFSIMLDEFGCDLDRALAAYNAGPKYLRENDGAIPPYKETKAYIKKVRKYYKYFAVTGKKTQLSLNY